MILVFLLSILIILLGLNGQNLWLIRRCLCRLIELGVEYDWHSAF